MSFHAEEVYVENPATRPVYVHSGLGFLCSHGIAGFGPDQLVTDNMAKDTIVLFANRLGMTSVELSAGLLAGKRFSIPTR